MTKSRYPLNWLLITIFALAVLLGFYKALLSESPESTNFGMKRQWSQILASQVVDVSLISNPSMALVRTRFNLYSLDIKTGEMNWETKISNQTSPSTPISVNGLVFIVDRQVLRALDQEDGDVVWDEPLSQPNGWVVDASEKIVLVNEVSRAMHAYNAATGTPLWQMAVGRGQVKAYIDDAAIYIPDHGILGIESTSGKFLWRIGDDTIGQSAFSDGIIYYVSDDNVVAFDTRKQAELWRMHYGLSDVGFPALQIEAENLFLMDGDSLYLIDQKTGVTAWETSVSQPKNLTVLENVAYVLEGINRVIYAVDITTGEKISALKISSPAFIFTDSQEIDSVNGILLIANGREVVSYGH